MSVIQKKFHKLNFKLWDLPQWLILFHSCRTLLEILSQQWLVDTGIRHFAANCCVLCGGQKYYFKLVISHPYSVKLSFSKCFLTKREKNRCSLRICYLKSILRRYQEHLVFLVCLVRKWNSTVKCSTEVPHLYHAACS